MFLSSNISTFLILFFKVTGVNSLGSANGLFGASDCLDSLFSEFLSESPRNLSLMLPNTDVLFMIKKEKDKSYDVE